MIVPRFPILFKKRFCEILEAAAKIQSIGRVIRAIDIAFQTTEVVTRVKIIDPPAIRLLPVVP